ncbi:hypothetical protein J7L85_03885 [candidate division WOR-3 bacterium]|nr:hypothetical protein [candidate division WOR-3 bacterium]
MGMREIIEGEDKVWVSGEITVNLGNYENIKIMNGCSYTLAPGEDGEGARKRLTEEIMEELFLVRDDLKKAQIKRRRRIMKE